MNDIVGRTDIEEVVAEFYRRAIADDTIGHFFTEVVKLDFEKHIPIICDFWETVLFGSMTYKGNPVAKHIEINEKQTLQPPHFERWLQIWETTISERFRGEKAQEAISRAKQMALLIEHKVNSSTGRGFIK